MSSPIFKLFGLKNQGLLVITPNELVLTNVSSGTQEVFKRVSKHPRSIIGNFYEVEIELKQLVKKVFPSWYKFTQIIVCLDGQNEGGYTTIELRATRELVYGAGGLEVYVAKSVLSISQAKEVFEGNSKHYINQDA